MFNVVPFPAVVPPHEIVYHCQVAPVPSVPPVSVSVVGVPGQTVRDGVPETELGTEETELTVTTAV